MVIDLDDLRVRVKRAAVDRSDHATLRSTEDPLAAAITQMQAEAPEKGLPSGIMLERAVIRETPMCSAAINRDRP